MKKTAHTPNQLFTTWNPLDQWHHITRISLMFCGGWIFLAETFQCFPNFLIASHFSDPKKSKPLLELTHYRSLYSSPFPIPRLQWNAFVGRQGQQTIVIHDAVHGFDPIRIQIAFAEDVFFYNGEAVGKRKRRNRLVVFCQPFLWGGEVMG